jgi:PilZ domain
LPSGVERRAAIRVNSHIPVQLQYKEARRPLIVHGHTLSVSISGCFVVAQQALPVGKPVRVKNQLNGFSCQAEVVRHGQPVSDGWELGIRLLDCTQEFWGLDFALH